MMTSYVIPTISYLPLKFRFIACEAAHLPVFKGSLLRGGLGHSLRRTVCVMNADQPCTSCLLNRQCVYTNLFETLILEEPPRFLRGLQNSPRPFIFQTNDEKRVYQPGEFLEFELALLGKSAASHPYMIYAIQQMAERGLGARRFKFRLQEVYFQDHEKDWQLLYEGDSQKLLLSPPVWETTALPYPSLAENIEIQFLTPTRLRFGDRFRMDFSFRKLLFKMLRRILELAYFYLPDAPINWEFHDLLKAADQIEITDRQLSWKGLKRYSNRQKASVSLGGFTGSIELQGNLSPFMDILKACEVLHVGKSTAFGLGKIKIKKLQK